MEIAFAELTGMILSFIAQSLNVELPHEADERCSFEISGEKCTCECVSVPERMLWTVHFEFISENETAWFYDISILRDGNRLLFGLKIDTLHGADVKTLQKDLPLLDSLIASGLLKQGRPIGENLWQITTPDDVAELIALLQDQNRTLPVVVISAVNRSAWSITPFAPDFLVNAQYLADRVKGYAIVAQLNFQMAFVLSDQIGKSWSVFDGACRTYFPKINFDNGIPAHQPRTFKDRIWYWSYENLHGEKAYTAFLIDTVYKASANNRTDWQGLYFVPDARILAAELEMAHAAHLANAPIRERAMERHINALQRKLETAESENTDWLTELETAEKAAEYYKHENAALRMQIDALRSHLRRQVGSNIDTEIVIPDNYKVMGEWVEKNLAGRLVLLPRAERAAGKAEYEDVAMVYQALLILANEYRDSRMGIGSDEVFQNELKKYGMEFSGSIDKSRAGQEAEAYYVNYPIGTNHREFLQFHIVRGTSRNNLHCMRVYFFWDKETNQVVVGWLPSHLNNRFS